MNQMTYIIIKLYSVILRLILRRTLLSYQSDSELLLLMVMLFCQDFVSNADVSDTSAGTYEMTTRSDVPLNGSCLTSLSRHHVTSLAAQIISNSTASASSSSAAVPAASSAVNQPSSAACSSGPTTDSHRTIAGTANEQQLSRMLDKIYETIELNELRLLIQDHKDAVKLEWQQVISIYIIMRLRTMFMGGTVA